MECEDGDWWCYGVQPGALAASGSTPAEAYGAFHTALITVLFDIASEARGMDHYRNAVERFFREDDPAEGKRWDAAVDAFRSGREPEAPFDKLPKLPADTALFVTVEPLTETRSVTAGTNILPEYALPEAVAA
jgi:hypothetical protein